MKISHKLISGYLLVALLGSLTLYFTLHSFRKINDEFEVLMRDPVPTIKALENLKYAGVRIVSSTSEYGFIRSETAKTGENSMADGEEELITSGHRNYEESLRSYENLLFTYGDSNDSENLNEIKASGTKLLQISDEIVRLKTEGISGKEVLEKKEEFEEAEKAYLDAVSHSLEREYAELTRQQDNVQATVTGATQQTVTVTLAAFLLAIFFGVYISWLISRRINTLKEASERVGRGQFETKIEVGSKDEIGDLTRSFNLMISDLNGSRTELISAKNFTENIIGSMADALFVLDENLKISELNQATLKITGFLREELIGQPIEILCGNDELLSIADLKVLHKNRFIRDIDRNCKTKTGALVPVALSASIMKNHKGGKDSMVCVARDVSEHKILQAQLAHQAFHDPLTNLANRALFQDRVEQALARAKRRQVPLAVLFLDLDDFKNINDSLGHAVGDNLLKLVAQRLENCIRTGDTVARFGGDEFAILLEETEQPHNAIEIAERVLKILEQPLILENSEINIGVSIGIAVSRDGAEAADELLRNADVAMYIAKEQGRGRFTVFEAEMHISLMARLNLEADLHRALDAHEFILHYQPIVYLKTGELNGFEALVRWQHPTRGMIPPLDFIEIAEKTGLIIELGRWVTNEACRQLKEFQEKFGTHIKMTVNVSGKQFQHPDFVRDVANALARHSIYAPNLTLEITESIMMQNSKTTLERLQDLKNLNVRLAIDDFGTGYSSLSYLQQFPIDILKIDKSFVDDVSKGAEESAVARTIISLSETLKMQTIAEGIEHAEQIITLIEGGCELGQGFYFSKPMRAEAINETFGKNHSADPIALPDYQKIETKSVQLV
jgi:diguanylate cyclase (GGDEF)-like protein/PAS domain S-box-containing protein